MGTRSIVNLFHKRQASLENEKEPVDVFDYDYFNEIEPTREKEQKFSSALEKERHIREEDKAFKKSRSKDIDQVAEKTTAQKKVSISKFGDWSGGSVVLEDMGKENSAVNAVFNVDEEMLEEMSESGVDTSDIEVGDSVRLSSFDWSGKEVV